MSFLNCIGEFFLFRWLFGKLQSNEVQKNVPESCERQSFINDDAEDNEISVDMSNSYHRDDFSYNPYADNDYDWNGQSFNDFHEEQDDYDMMDDF